MYQRLLLAYDGSEAGRQALLTCGDLSNLTHAEIFLLAVTPLSSTLFVGEGFIPADVVQIEKNRYRDILNEGIKELQQQGFKVKGSSVCGEPVDEICHYAKEISADLIIVGHQHQDSWAKRWWRGSVSASLIEHSPCSVLVTILNKQD